MNNVRSVSNWECVHFLDRATLSASDIGMLSGCAVLECDVSDVGSDLELFAKLSSSLQFPDYFGNNWDALDECLSDMEWIPASGYMLVISGARQLWSNLPTTAGKLVSAWLAAASIWAEGNVPFNLVFMAE